MFEFRVQTMEKQTQKQNVMQLKLEFSGVCRDNWAQGFGFRIDGFVRRA